MNSQGNSLNSSPKLPWEGRNMRKHKKFQLVYVVQSFNKDTKKFSEVYNKLIEMPTPNVIYFKK